MNFYIEWNKVQNIFHVVYMGLWVLFIYVYWFTVRDLFFSLCITKLKKYQNKLEIQVKYFMDTFTLCEQKKLQAELALITKDVLLLENKREKAFYKNCIHVLTERFPNNYMVKEW